jgi:uncharacterized protein
MPLETSSFLIVSNTSPISNLAHIGHLDLLPRLFDTILIPEIVRSELFASNTVRQQVQGAIEQGWLRVEIDMIESTYRHCYSLQTTLDAGEAAAIALAAYHSATILLIDERLGRAVAQSLNLKITGVVGILLRAKERGFIYAIKPLLERLVNDTGFYLSPALVRQALTAAGE